MQIKHLLSTSACAIALATAGLATTVAHAQNSNKATTPADTMTPASPTTPPTHPSERGKPSTSPATSTNDGTTTGSPEDKAGGGSKAEAAQTCKNLSGEQAQADCMKTRKGGNHKAGMNHGGASAPSM